MADSETMPEYSGWALFLISLSQGFLDCYRARVSQNLPALYNRLEATSLLLAGHYKNNKDKKIKEELLAVKPEIDRAIKDFEKNEEYSIKPQVWNKLYEIEWLLREAWKESGLQVTMGDSSDELKDY